MIMWVLVALVVALSLLFVVVVAGVACWWRKQSRPGIENKGRGLKPL